MRVFLTIGEEPKIEANPDIPKVVITKKELDATGDPDIMKRKVVTAVNMLFKEYDEVIVVAPHVKVTEDVSPLIDEKADLIGLKDAKIIEKKKQAYAVWDVPPISYVTTDFLIVRNKQMAKEWLEMTFKPFFKKYNNYEADVLNIVIYYGDYNSKIIDVSALKGVQV